jgi:ABC-2 type transport system ATP-binding protein
MRSSFITIKDLTHRYQVNDQPVIDQFNCEISAGEMIGLVGPDGAGKTTLLRILTGLLKPTLGTCLIDQVDMIQTKNIPPDLIRYMPQKFGLYEDLTVGENLNLYADLNSLTKEEKKIQKERLLQFTKLEPFQKRLARDLSGGMKQKLGLACTLLKKPKLLILDEPTVGVDPISRIELWQMIKDLMEDHMTIICSTSYLDEVEHFQSVLILNNGKCLYQGSPEEIKKTIQGRSFLIQDLKLPKREALGKLLSEKEVLDGTILGNSIRILTKKGCVESCEKEMSLIGNINQTSATFEDAFFDLIPETPHRRSPIYDIYPTFSLIDHPLIEAHELSKQFGSFKAVDQISFQVKQGEIFGLLGPNGAGKSTTFKMICGLMKPSFGDAKIKNISLLDAPSQARAKVGYMAQKFSLYSNMTVLQNLRFFYGIYPKFTQKNHVVDEMISTFFLEPYLNSLTKDLPLGFKQRLSLACSIMHRPEVLFLDEPTSGVDPITRREFWSHINALVSKNVAIVVTTHFMDEAEYCDRIGLVNQGKLIAIGSPDELKKLAITPSNPTPSLEDAFIHLTKEGIHHV